MSLAIPTLNWVEQSVKFWLEPVALAWYPKLLHASQEELQNWKIAGGGYGIHWPELDEDLSTEGLLRGAPATRQPTKA